MKISEVVSLEINNTHIILHKEGIFCLLREILIISLAGWMKYQKDT
jgi:hypothetical protein